jgi:hypothetical protein
VIWKWYEEGHLSTTTGKPMTISGVKWLRFKHKIPAPQPAEGTLNVRQVCERYGVSLYVVHYWIEREVVSAAQRKPNAPYEITIDEESDQRLRDWIANSAHLHRLLTATA